MADGIIKPQKSSFNYTNNFLIENWTSPSKTSNAKIGTGGGAYMDYTISKAGYIPIAVLGFYFTNLSDGSQMTQTQHTGIQITLERGVYHLHCYQYSWNGGSVYLVANILWQKV